MRAAFPVLTAFFCCFSLPGFAQQAAPQSPVTPPAEGATTPTKDASRRITLDVVVTDKSGKPVPGLQQQDFIILDDKQPQTILTFHATDETSKTDELPLQVILLVDAVNTSFHSVGYERLQLDKFLRQNDGELPIPTSLVLLTDTSQGQTPSTLDGNVLASSLDSNQSGLRAIGRSQGFYGAADRVDISLGTLEKLISHLATQPGRKLLIWLSPGWPLLSGPEVELSAKDREWLFRNVVNLSTELREARITLYSIDPLGMDDAMGRRFYYESFLKGVGSANQVQNGNLGLQVIAAQTGGQVLNSSNDIQRLVASCLADAKAFYTLSFDSPPADHPNEYHSLQVKIGKPGLTARTRTGYYAQR
ncbi:MAG: VWA domain-containing protein [Candidatus Sulfotelmatobacter sp.]